jgi:predicted Ser/Thr protein kinase
MTVFQAEDNGVLDVTDAAGKLDLVCSVSARAYSTDGQLKQASTGFFEFKRMSEV